MRKVSLFTLLAAFGFSLSMPVLAVDKPVEEKKAEEKKMVKEAVVEAHKEMAADEKKEEAEAAKPAKHKKNAKKTEGDHAK